MVYIGRRSSDNTHTPLGSLLVGLRTIAANDIHEEDIPLVEQELRGADAIIWNLIETLNLTVPPGLQE